jgi:hypothetical protein
MGRDILEPPTMFGGRKAVLKMFSFRPLRGLFARQCGLDPAGVTGEPRDPGEAAVVVIKGSQASGLQSPQAPFPEYPGHKGQRGELLNLTTAAYVEGKRGPEFPAVCPEMRKNF